MSFHNVFGGDDGYIYAVDETQTLFWYQDMKRDGNRTSDYWANGGSGVPLGQGLGYFPYFSGGNGTIYAGQLDGRLLFYQVIKADNGLLKINNENKGKQIGEGWGEFSSVFNGGEGIIYVVQKDGTLLWYRDLNRDGNRGWAYDGYGQVIGNGWGIENFKFVFGGGDGIIYAIRNDGTLFWYKDLARNGKANWANDGFGKVIGEGWNVFSFVFYGGNGIIYAVQEDGTLLWYQDRKRDGNRVADYWAFGGVGRPIGTGWNRWEELELPPDL